MESEITYKLSEKDLEQVLERKLTVLLKTTVLERYRDRLISVDAVAEIHGIHRDTVIRYAKANLIPSERQGKLYKFSLAQVLDIDFHQLRTRKSMAIVKY